MICPICRVEKPLDEFPKKPTGGPYSWMCRPCERNRSSLRKHGLTIEQKGEIAAGQHGCAICGHPDPNSRGWVVDHDHDCCPGEKSCIKCRRGIICSWCNSLLGNAFDRPQILRAAIAYLERHASGTCEWHMPVACTERICGKSFEHDALTDGLGRTNAESLVTSESESHVTQRARAGQENPLASAVTHA